MGRIEYNCQILTTVLKVSKFRKQIFQVKLFPKNKFDGSVFGRKFGKFLLTFSILYDGNISWTMTSRGDFFSKWANVRGHYQRVTLFSTKSPLFGCIFVDKDDTPENYITSKPLLTEL